MSHAIPVCLNCGAEPRDDLAFCAACDAELAEDANALAGFEKRSGCKHWLLAVRMATHGMGGITAYTVGGTSRLDQANALGTQRGAWAHESNNPGTSRLQLILVDSDGMRYVLRDKRFDDRIHAHPTVSVELERAARLDDPQDPIWGSIHRRDG